MAFLQLFVAATKVAGLLITVTVASHAFSFSRFKRKNLRPFRSPIDETADTLAVFNVDGGENEFFFGLATAPAHVEDHLDDAWLQFAEESPCDKSNSHEGGTQADALIGSAAADGGSHQACLLEKEAKRTMKKKKPMKIAMEAMIRGFEKFIEEEEEVSTSSEGCHHNVAAWHNVPHPEERLRFWSDPDTELKLAKDTGISIFRMGIDWTRIMPEEPVNGLKQTVNYAALERYKWIINRVRSYGMKVMLTLFHHSLPPWAGEYGGWKMEKTIDYFMDFTRLVVDTVSDMVDYWVTFNEPHVFCMLTYCAGAWPGGHPDMLEVVTSALPKGVFQQALHWMAIAHSKAYDYIHEKSMISNPLVGAAHHVSFMRPYGLFDIAAVSLANSLTLFPYLDSISDKMDYIGINYYGQEVVSGAGLKLVETDEYSESGRGVYPDGLYRMLIQFHERYKHLNVPFIISENGVSDGTDMIRRPYLLEHLLAIHAAMIMGVPVLGYLFWTISDNWEWADGYGPKFGLVAVDRANGLARIPRPSYHLFTKVATTGKITREDRAHVWRELLGAAKEKKKRPFYRAVDKHGLMYAGGLDQPIERPYIERDWRFGHYEMDGLQDPFSSIARCILRPFSTNRKSISENDDTDLVLQPLELSL
ncbi:beta-glucosidase-like SFR2 chloroplastic isoform X2 [Tripterygium wilfordii]|uniref:Beta-glucosidase-like SFR2 chloroplastic isoform X2 n=1 Tax=Tripterygium wilfordii TaxID=458696 RepID=A0A7J7CXJ5_TRIWF|nr:beta-glucosidase-like SFR2, chloroplastic [Tripterygium wilfordii]KAF5738784.1 beta-glucosidase-like SFR2 chloroplastic isoform X2 [Tripterygium wilfordii]